jgi:hypothetical protein
MAAWIVGALAALVILKPQEFVEALQGLPLVYVVFAAAVVAIIVDVIWRKVRPALAPQLVFIVLFFAWGLVTTAMKHPDALESESLGLAIVLGLFLVVAIGMASSFGLRAFALTFVSCALAVTVVALVQGNAPLGCMLGAPEDWEGKGELVYDGRPCETILDCRKDAPVPDGNYRCEHVGPWRTSSIGGRVRYRGSLADPNELSLMASMAIPFILAVAERRRAKPKALARASRPDFPAPVPHLLSDKLLVGISDFVRSIPVLAVVAAIGFVIVLAQSRSGLIVFLVVLGAYLVRRAGAWGLVGGCLVGPPMLLFGGRAGAEAEQSSNERVELLREAFDMIRGTKGIGIGLGQFSDESSIGLTAHNAYVLAASEAGLIGMCLFALAVYASIKVPVAIWFGDYDLDETVSRIAPAMAIALGGAVIGIFFLSWAYKDILYMLLASSAALYGAARAQDPRVVVRISWKEVALVCVAMALLLFGLYVAARLRGH